MWTMFVGRAAASLVTTVLVARALGPEGRGAVTSVVSLSGLLALIATAGMGVSMLRGLRLLHSHPRDLYSDALDVGLAWSALIGTALAAWAWLQPDQREMLLLTGVAVIPQVAQLSLANAATLDNRVWPVTWTTLVGVGGYASGTVVQITVDQCTVRANLLLWTATTGLSCLLLAWACRRRFSRRRPHAFRWFWPRSVRATTASAAVLAIWRIDVLLVQAQRGFAELGQYGVAVGAAEVLVTLGTGVTTAVLPDLARSGHGPDAASIVCRVTRLTLAALSTLALALAVTAGFVVPAVFGDEYRRAVPAFVLLLPGVICFVAHTPLFNYVSSRGGTRGLTQVAVGGLVLNVAGNIVLLRWFDLTAAAVVSTVTYAGLLAGCLTLFCRRAGLPLVRVLVPERRDFVDAARAARSLIPARS